jgi:hypothetical protein
MMVTGHSKAYPFAVLVGIVEIPRWRIGGLFLRERWINNTNVRYKFGTPPFQIYVATQSISKAYPLAVSVMEVETVIVK